MLFSTEMEHALRWALVCHRGQERRGSGVPYAQHVVAVAMILDRAGYPEEVVIAGLLHDAVEDTDVSLECLRDEFGPAVAALVAHASEVKLDADGQKRPWIDRKRDHLAALADAPANARALALADKLHNLLSIARDLADGRPVWSLFHADRKQVMWYYRAAIATLAVGEEADPMLGALAAECRLRLAEVESIAV